ncbi:glycine-rich cell wall structural protein 1.8-like [Contarinia nasturtii]|uniref:glycine-rich cell wall structural protein 1.8-like n=1 Tax=Contarinia nasturtii TaxID=265458 RepID=UPI0012D416F3|nr:glycine-rich cell wall structural protein 1.8-like [Contarinia nasturtii]
MKFTIAAIVLAFALFANANVVVDIASPHSPVGSHGPALVNAGGSNYGGWGYGGDAYSGYSVGYPKGGPKITLHTTGNLGYGGYDGGYGGGYGAGIGAGGYAGGHGAGVGAGADYHNGKYVASNRGAVHVAPLVGHIQSVKSTNEQPAPGTTW